MDPNQNPDQKNQDLMIAPEDSLIETTNQLTTEEVPLDPQITQEGVSYTPPQSWGGDQTSAPAGTPSATSPPEMPPFNPQATPSPLSTPLHENLIQTAPLVAPLPPTPPTEAPNSFFRTFLIAIVLILVGILLGIMASKFVPMTPSMPLSEEPTPEPTVEASPSGIPILTPTATPSALLDLKWNMMTVKSPLTQFMSYRIYYPGTWSIKEYKNVPRSGDLGSSTLTLMKGKTKFNIFQAAQLAPICDFSGNPDTAGEGVVQLGDFKGLSKGDGLEWRWAPSLNVAIPEYLVCESKTADSFGASTSIGFINFSGEVIDADTLDEINYILEKIVILPSNGK